MLLDLFVRNFPNTLDIPDFKKFLGNVDVSHFVKVLKACVLPRLDPSHGFTSCNRPYTIEKWDLVWILENNTCYFSYNFFRNKSRSHRFNLLRLVKIFYLMHLLISLLLSNLLIFCYPQMVMSCLTLRYFIQNPFKPLIWNWLFDCYFLLSLFFKLLLFLLNLFCVYYVNQRCCRFSSGWHPNVSYQILFFLHSFHFRSNRVYSSSDFFLFCLRLEVINCF